MKSLILALLPFAACSSQGAFSSAYPGNYLILVDKTDNELQVIEPNSGWTRDSAPTDPGPHEVAASRDGQYAVTADYGDATPGHTLDVYSLLLRRMDYTIDIAPYTRPHGIAFLDRRTRLLVTSEASNAVLEVDITSRSVVRAMNTGGERPRLLAIASDRSRVYTTNMGSGTVSAIDLSTGQVVNSASVGNEPEAIDLSPDGAELWVGLRKDDKLVVLDAHTLEKRAELSCAHFPTRLKFTPDGDRVLVANNGSGDVAVFDARARRETLRIALAPQAEDGVYPPEFAGGEHPGPADLLIEPRGRYAYVSESRTNRLLAIDLSKLVICGSIQTGNGPCGLSWTFIPEMSPFMTR
jgi:YVTN family beta-propeller protein